MTSSGGLLPYCRRISWESELPVGCVRVARHAYSCRDRGTDVHDHEYAEFVWIEQGVAEHQINGRREILHAHDFRCLRPHDVHLARASEDADCTLINISFELKPLDLFAERYGSDWMWPAEGPPRGGTLTPTMRERLSAWLEILSAPSPRRLDLESFLLDLMRMLSSGAGGARATNLPAWLAHALESFAEPRHLHGGVPELARMCGRSQEHLNRTVRLCQGRRATDLVNAFRMDWVASQLHASERSIEDLAAECGLANLAHFYRLFKSAYGTTPAAWRKELRRELPQAQPINLAPWANRK